jgi:integrase
VRVRWRVLAAGFSVGIFCRKDQHDSEKTNMSLTDTKVRSLNARKAQYKVTDGEGLYLLITPSGGKLWRLAYRFLGKQKSLALGKYPEISLLEARRGRDEAKRLLAKGTDPSHAKKAEKRERLIAAGNTFGAVAEEWFENNSERWVGSYSSRLRSRLDADLLPVLSSRPIAEITPLEVLDVIRKIEKRDAIEMAKRVMQMASGVFRYGVATARCARDPTVDLKGALRPTKATKHRTALPPAEILQFMRDLERYDGDIVTRLAVKLVVLTFVRTAELRFARWNEFDALDGPEPLWRIPADRMKMRRPHLVPLAPQAVEVLCKLRRITGKTPYLFPARTKTGVISENTLIFALYRMGYHSRATVHGFRSTASTALNEAQFNRDWIEMQLAHFDGSVRGVYNAAEWLPGRRQMMAWWGNYVDGVRKQRLAAV